MKPFIVPSVLSVLVLLGSPHWAAQSDAAGQQPEDTSHPSYHQGRATQPAAKRRLPRKDYHNPKKTTNPVAGGQAIRPGDVADTGAEVQPTNSQVTEDNTSDADVDDSITPDSDAATDADQSERPEHDAEESDYAIETGSPISPTAQAAATNSPIILKITNLRILADGSAEITIMAPTGQPFQLERSTDLTNWASIIRQTAENTAAVLVDDAAAAYPCAFYRTTQE